MYVSVSLFDALLVRSTSSKIEKMCLRQINQHHLLFGWYVSYVYPYRPENIANKIYVPNPSNKKLMELPPVLVNLMLII